MSCDMMVFILSLILLSKHFLNSSSRILTKNVYLILHALASMFSTLSNALWTNSPPWCLTVGIADRREVSGVMATCYINISG